MHCGTRSHMLRCIREDTVEALKVQVVEINSSLLAEFNGILALFCPPPHNENFLKEIYSQYLNWLKLK